MMRTEKLTSGLRFLILWALLLAAATLSSVVSWAGAFTPETLQILIFGQTQTGRALSVLLIGSPVRGESDIQRLLSRLARSDSQTRALRHELELRLSQISRELDRYPYYRNHMNESLDGLANRFLRFEKVGQELHFTPFISEEVSSSFARSAKIFLEASPPTRFESTVPRGGNSLDGLLRPQDSIYERLIALELKYVHELGVLDIDALAQRLAFRKSNLTVRDIR